MLYIENLVWVISGMCGLWAYNLTTVRTAHRLEGARYIFAVAFFALPYYLCLVLIPNISKLEVLLISIIPSIGYGLLLSSLSNLIFFYKENGVDPFHRNCALWLGKLVLITLENNEIYFGTLIEHTKDISYEYSLSIILSAIGYRNNSGEVVWNSDYLPSEEGTNDSELAPTVIARSKIVTLTLWNRSAMPQNIPAGTSGKSKDGVK